MISAESGRPDADTVFPLVFARTESILESLEFIEAG
ncbi:MAG: hypothetical protein ACI81L_001560 [Verrucomicrobiales bacterium]|jgi:hypothetical protein